MARLFFLGVVAAIVWRVAASAAAEDGPGSATSFDDSWLQPELWEDGLSSPSVTLLEMMGVYRELATVDCELWPAPYVELVFYLFEVPDFVPLLRVFNIDGFVWRHLTEYDLVTDMLLGDEEVADFRRWVLALRDATCDPDIEAAIERMDSEPPASALDDARLLLADRLPEVLVLALSPRLTLAWLAVTLGTAPLLLLFDGPWGLAAWFPLWVTHPQLAAAAMALRHLLPDYTLLAYGLAGWFLVGEIINGIPLPCASWRQKMADTRHFYATAFTAGARRRRHLQAAFVAALVAFVLNFVLPSLLSTLLFNALIIVGACLLHFVWMFIALPGSPSMSRRMQGMAVFAAVLGVVLLATDGRKNWAIRSVRAAGFPSCGCGKRTHAHTHAFTDRTVFLGGGWG